jgi:SET domain-containing protein
VGDRCTNKKFQKSQFAPVEVFKTEKKGLGLRAAANIPYGEFILEYVGEVLDHEEFDVRADDYSNDKNRHYYFMSLRADAIIDATIKGKSTFYRTPMNKMFVLQEIYHVLLITRVIQMRKLKNGLLTES